MFDSTRTIDLIVAYLEALGLASGGRARRRALWILNECRARTGGDAEILDAELLRMVREQVMQTAELSERALPPEIPARMPPQAFRCAVWRGDAGRRAGEPQPGKSPGLAKAARS